MEELCNFGMVVNFAIFLPRRIFNECNFGQNTHINLYYVFFIQLIILLTAFIYVQNKFISIFHVINYSFDCIYLCSKWHHSEIPINSWFHS
jgi:hypothetical protein